jgi:hypothetical protein
MANVWMLALDSMQSAGGICTFAPSFGGSKKDNCASTAPDRFVDVPFFKRVSGTAVPGVARSWCAGTGWKAVVADMRG